MCQLNKIGHDFSRVQVGKGRFTYECRLASCVESGQGKPCSATSRSVVSVPRSDEPESFFIGKMIRSVWVEILTRITRSCRIKTFR